MGVTDMVRGRPGRPKHPPLTDATIGTYLVVTIFAVLAEAGFAEAEMATAWWGGIHLGLALGVLAMLTGLADWVAIPRAAPAWPAATTHMTVMLAASALFGVAATMGSDAPNADEIGTAPLVLTIVGFAALMVGGWLGGALVFIHGLRVVPARRGAEGGSGEDITTSKPPSPTA